MDGVHGCELDQPPYEFMHSYTDGNHWGAGGAGVEGLLINVRQDLIVSSRSHWYEHDSLFDIRDSGCFALSHLFDIARAVQFVSLMLTQAEETKARLVLSARRI